MSKAVKLTSACQRASHVKDSVQCLGYNLVDWANFLETPIRRSCRQMSSIFKSHRNIIYHDQKLKLGERKAAPVVFSPFLSPARSVN